MTSAQYIGQQIKKRRERLGLTQADLAGRLHVKPGTVSRYESGDIAVTAPDLPSLARILGVTISYFYENEDDNRNAQEIEYEAILDELHSASYSGGLEPEDVSEVAEIIRMKARRRAERQGRA